MNRNVAGLVAMVMVTMALGRAGAVTASTVKFDYDRTVDFASYRSFAWKAGAKSDGDSLAAKRIESALEAGFRADGFAQAKSAKEADFLIDYRAGVRRDFKIREGLRSPGFGRDLSVGAVPTGVLLVEVYDAESGEIAWRGTVTDALASDPEKADKKTARAVEKLLKQFPPETK